MSNIPVKFLSSVKRIWKSSSSLYKTGIVGLDMLLGGGFAKRSIVMMLGSPDTGLTTILNRFYLNFKQNLKLVAKQDWFPLAFSGKSGITVYSDSIVYDYEKTVPIISYIEDDLKNSKMELSIYSKTQLVNESLFNGELPVDSWEQLVDVVLQINKQVMEVWIKMPDDHYFLKIGETKFEQNA